MHNPHLQLWRLSGPLIISNLSIAMLGIVDTAVVGHLSHPHFLGAVAVATVIFDFVYWGMGFLRMGTTGIIAQAHGMSDAGAIRKSLIHALVIAQCIALLLLATQAPILAIGLYLIGGSEDVLHYAAVYFNWTIWGAPAVLGSLALVGCLLGLQNARATLYYAVTVNVVNIILDLLLVFGLDMGVKGVALASVLSQYCGFLLAALLVGRELKKHPAAWDWQAALDLPGLARMLVLNQNIFIRTICLIFVFGYFARQGAAQGDIILASNAVLMNFQAITALGLDGFANATEALAGRAIGAGNRDQFRNVVQAALLWSLIVALLFSVVYWLGGQHLIHIMTSIREVQMAAMNYLAWLIASPLISVWCFLLDGIFIGAVRGREMRNAMLFSTFLVFLPTWYLLSGLGNHGLWLAFMIFFAARGLSLGWYYYNIEKSQGGFIALRADAG